MRTKKIYCIKRTKYKKILKIKYTFSKILVVSVISDKCDSKVEILFKEEESIEILKILAFYDFRLYWTLSYFSLCCY